MLFLLLLSPAKIALLFIIFYDLEDILTGLGHSLVSCCWGAIVEQKGPEKLEWTMSWQSANIVDWKWKMNLMWPFLASLVHTLSLRLWRFFELIMLIDIQHNTIQSNHDYFRDLIVISKGEGKIRTFWLSSNLDLPDILNNSFRKKT